MPPYGRFQVHWSLSHPDDPQEVIGVSFAGDVIKGNRQLIRVLRECNTSFTASCLIRDERHDTLRDALTQLIVGLHPLDGPSAIIRVDPAPGFTFICNNDSLKHLNVTIEVGRVKNKKKNPVVEKAVRELDDELIRQEPGDRQVSDVGLVLATACLNSRLRRCGLSSRELWTQRNQFTHEQLPVTDYQVILDKHEQRSYNHAFSERSKNPRGLVPSTQPLQVGDIVYLVSDKDKSRARDRQIVVSFDPPWCFVKKFSGSQLRATSCKVKLSECYAVPPSILVSNHPGPPLPEDKDDPSTQDKDDEPPPVTTSVPPAPVHPGFPPPAPPELTTVPSIEEHSTSFTSDVSTPDVPIPTPSVPVVQEEPNTSITDQHPSPPSTPPDPPGLLRPQRQRRPPLYLIDYDYVRF